jgi:hypothetical protein
MRLRDLKHRQLESTRYRSWLWAQDPSDYIYYDDHTDEPDDSFCGWCGGDGYDALTDYTLPCPHCNGDGR